MPPFNAEVAAMKRSQATVQEWLSSNTTIAASKTDDNGRRMFLAEEWKIAAEQVKRSGRVVPLAIICGLNHVLDEREGLTKRYQGTAVPEEQDSTAAHAYFNDCLRTALTALKSTQPRPKPLSTVLLTASPSQDLNQYQMLDTHVDKTPATSSTTTSTAIAASPFSKSQLAINAAATPKSISPRCTEEFLRYYLGDIFVARGILYHMFDDSNQDTTQILLASRCFILTSTHIIDALEAPLQILQANQTLVRSLAIELNEQAMRETSTIPSDSLSIALEELEIHASTSTEPVPLTRNNVPMTLDKSDYRGVIRTLLDAISAANLQAHQHQTTLESSVVALVYIARAMRGEANHTTAAILLTMVVDTTHNFLWATWDGGAQSAKSMVEEHMRNITGKITDSLRAPEYLNIVRHLLARDEQSAATSLTQKPPLTNLMGLLAVPALHDDALHHLPCVSAHQLLVTYQAWAEAIPVFLNNCLVLPIVLIGYKLLRQLDLITESLLLEKLLAMFEQDILERGSVSRFSTKWHSLLGGKTIGNRKKTRVAEVTEFQNAPNRIRLTGSFMLQWPCGGHLANDDYIKAVMPCIVGRAQGTTNQNRIRAKMTPHGFMPPSMQISADLSAVWNELDDALPNGLMNHLAIYSFSLSTMAAFDNKLANSSHLGVNLLPNRKIDPADAAYSGIAAMSALLAKVDKMLERGQRKELIKDAALAQLASCYQAIWFQDSVWEHLRLF
ncbi:hypothetical protein DDE83_000138 [Stemphylium lycopersici]|uniref:DUF6604 domain-containing protein n=1 Tax=Stemphylium lycopersici TaxID=183478 RepID=A0A364NHJ2_STELY|nr:hypothetical protein DDE83_000138 [Stemphylium lycopersici]